MGGWQVDEIWLMVEQEYIKRLPLKGRRDQGDVGEVLSLQRGKLEEVRPCTGENLGKDDHLMTWTVKQCVRKNC